jgi:hypothetical protein
VAYSLEFPKEVADRQMGDYASWKKQAPRSARPFTVPTTSLGTARFRRAQKRDGDLGNTRDEVAKWNCVTLPA